MNKIILLISLLFFAAFGATAQIRDTTTNFIMLNRDGRNDCGTPTPPANVIKENERRVQQFMQRGVNFTIPLAIPIKAHIVQTTNGNGGLSISVLNAAISQMNTKFAAINMSFYLCGGIHYIDDDNLYDNNVDTDDTLLVQNNVNDAINIYFVGNLTSGINGLNGISSFPSGNPLGNRIILWNTAASNNETLPHEMAHYWNVYHTHETYFGAELVNGNNCTTVGDLVCDTPADPCCYNYDETTCTYTGTNTDANGQSYSPLVHNLMSYYGGCRQSFTTGQYDRIEAGYSLRLSYMNENTYSLSCNALAAAAPSNVNFSQENCAVTLTWTDNATNETGYIIESATSTSGPFQAIGRVAANVTTYEDTRVSVTNGSTFYYRIIASNSNANYSGTSEVLINKGTNCYCIPANQSCVDGDVITRVQLMQGANVVLDKNSECSENGYSYTTSSVANLEKGTSYTISVSNTANPLNYEEGAVAWIDYNKNGIFEESEIVFTKVASVWTTASTIFTIPTLATSGETRMRVRIAYGLEPTDPCFNTDVYGETEDYLINITGECSATAPVATGASRCGTGTLNLTAQGCAGGTFNWFNDSTGGTSIGTGTNFTTPSISTTTTYYVECTIASCTSSRTSAIATVNVNLIYGTINQAAGTYQASETITSAATVATGTNYYAGKAIMLNPGFQAGSNEVFLAKIQGCLWY